MSLTLFISSYKINCKKLIEFYCKTMHDFSRAIISITRPIYSFKAGVFSCNYSLLDQQDNAHHPNHYLLDTYLQNFMVRKTRNLLSLIALDQTIGCPNPINPQFLSSWRYQISQRNCYSYPYYFHGKNSIQSGRSNSQYAR